MEEDADNSIDMEIANTHYYKTAMEEALASGKRSKKLLQTRDCEISELRRSLLEQRPDSPPGLGVDEDLVRLHQCELEFAFTARWKLMSKQRQVIVKGLPQEKSLHCSKGSTKASPKSAHPSGGN